MDATATVQRAVITAVAQAGPGRWAVACSGGVDSLVLAHAAAVVLGPAGIVVVHVDHGLQPATAQIADDVAHWCSSAAIACVVQRVTVPDGPSLEAQARQVRYAALHQAARRHAVPFVATAHHAGDQAETVLMRLIRGTGPAGLVAMRPQRGSLLRPFLALPRSILAQYARDHALPVWHDPMNHDLRFFRSRMRHQLLPLLKAENPQLETALGQFAQQLGQWQAELERNAEVGDLPWSQANARLVAPAARSVAWANALTIAGLPVTAAAHRGLLAALDASDHGTYHCDIPGGAIEVRYGDIHLYATGGEAATPVPLRVICDVAWTQRTRIPGDIMQPVRLLGRHRKLSDLYIDAKIPRAWRDTARLVVQADNPTRILWAEYLGPAWGSAITVEP